MALFKSGDPIIDEYNNYSTEQLIQIVTAADGNYSPGVLDTVRHILLSRGHYYCTLQQKAAENGIEGY